MGEEKKGEKKRAKEKFPWPCIFRPFFLALSFFVHFFNSPFIQKSSKPTIK
jgi:hypothetical protein